MSIENDIIAEIAAAQMKHLKWRSNLASAIAQGRSETTPERAACDKSCDFGKWFHGPSVAADLKTSDAWKGINVAHASFHATASRVLALALSGRQQEARDMLSGEFCSKADMVLKALSLWKLELKIRNGGPL
ncbi:CZB domain-containing protein [Rhodobacter sp. Har01]|uniref:CZB domain-containing protein n=1 Tax=Rhodobacter sp. Har01 TaxID=2883999 RepID=UPI001D074081|nr:CZB domain-containing protein [Rhodobacter sp. Har01]MCB6180198.1 CZB domain-containing protein [Rhodobacter sp. Har01]